jgi:hypothetical protein
MLDGNLLISVGRPIKVIEKATYANAALHSSKP